MPTLILKFKDKTLGEYPMEKGATLTIGRLADNDVVVENLAVSGHHAKVDSVGEGFLLTDLQSKNHTFVNEQMISSHWLKHGDVVLIGKHMLQFEDEEGVAKGGEPMGDMDQTMVMDTALQRDMLAKSTPKTSAKQMAPGQTALVSFLSGGQGEYVLEKKLTKIGKSDSNEIVVSGLMVGATAATISRRPNGYYLGYVGGMAKPKVNGKTVKESMQLKDFDTIEIGNAKLQFLEGKK